MLNSQEIAEIVSKKKSTQAGRGLRNPQEDVKLRGSKISEAIEAEKGKELKKASGGSMGATAGDYSEYGLKQVKASKADYDKGIVGDGLGNFYKAEGFERQQKDSELDTDQGDVFSSSLEKDSGKDFTNFNTIHDVEGALEALAGKNEPEIEKPTKPEKIQLSERTASSIALPKAYDEHVRSGDRTEAIFGVNPVDGTSDGPEKSLGDFTFKYKQYMKDLLRPSTAPSIRPEKKDKQGEGFQ